MLQKRSNRENGIQSTIDISDAVLVIRNLHWNGWGSKFPLIAVLNDSGELQKVLVSDLDLTDIFYIIVETDPINNEFLIPGGDSLSNESVLLRAIIPTDPENRGMGYYQLNLIDCNGNEYLRDDSGIFFNGVE